MRDIKELVNRIKFHYRTSNPRDIIEMRGINILQLPDDTEKDFLRGVYCSYKYRAYIFLNPNLCDYEKRIVCAHELGHAILHPILNAFSLATDPLSRPQKHEREADIFAAELLLEDDIFEKYYGYSFEHIASCECVPLHYVQLKYDNLG